MSRSRLEAFSDGVIAILVTIMVLELRPPHGVELADLGPLVPKLLSYVLSFVFLAIYWVNHHHLFHAVQRVDGLVLWANVHLLFWLSLVPVVTAWMGERGAAPVAVATYGAVLFLSGAAYVLLTVALRRLHGEGSVLARALGADWKGKASVLAYAVAIPLSFAERWAAIGIYVAVALVWFVPDRRIERVLGTRGE
ncbi:MAG TPA: TMEM175 family protein [Anaeromyxobacteraceae bacterium]|nr:TMEM175 family protein [Anaeromyxobacteraceae bacterium]